MSLRKTFTKAHIEHFQNNKHLITSELLEALRSKGNEGKQIALEILDTPINDEKYHIDKYGNKISFDGNRMLKGQYSEMDLTDIHVQEIKKCYADIFYFIANYVKIVTKSGVDFPEPRKYQQEFIDLMMDDDKTDIIAVYGRQSGKTVTVAMYLCHCLLFKKDINIGVCGNRGALAREFLDKVKKIYVELPMWMKVGSISWNKSYIEFSNGVRLMTDTTGPDSFRGFSCHMLVVDECAFVTPSSNWEAFSDSIFPSQGALAWKKNIIISTVNGKNHFYHMVKGAREQTNGYAICEMDWRDAPRYNSDGSIKDPEVFKNEIIAKYGAVYFAQNYECSFVGSSYTLISGETLEGITTKKPLEKRDGLLNIYHEPIKGHQYVMGVDPSMGISGDYFGIQILDITNLDMKQVASARLDMEYLKMPEYIHEWAMYYNSAYLIIENNLGSGQSIADIIVNNYEYENMHYDKSSENNKRKKYPGFRTTVKTRKQILDNMKLFMENGKLEINDEDTYKEFFTFIYTNNKFQADDGCKDDMLMALALCFAPFCNTRNFEDMRAISKVIFGEASDEDEVNIMGLLSFGYFDDGTEDASSNDGSWTYEMPYAYGNDLDPF